MKYTLGQNVQVTDYLVRVTASAQQIIGIAEKWEHLPENVLKRAEASLYPGEGKRPYRYLPKRNYRVWVPASLQKRGIDVPNLWTLELDSRNHPAPNHSLMTLPLEGIVVQQVQLQDGVAVNDYEEGSYFFHLSTTVGFKVAYHLNRAPLTVHPSMVKEV